MNIVVDGLKLSAGVFRGVVGVVSIDVQRRAGTELAVHVRKLMLRQAENQRDRLQLSNDQKSVGVGSMDDVADVDKAETDAATDRRGDAGIRELQFGVVNLALVRRDGAIELPNQRCLSVKLLLRDDAFFKQKLESFEIYFGVSALRLIFGELPQSLCKLDLERTRIDLSEQISFVDELPLLECDANELTIHATANRNSVEGGDR